MTKRVVDRYEVFESLGHGGAGAVFRARDPSGRAVALKLLTKLDARALARFDRERRLLATLGETEGFVGMIDAGTSQGVPYIVMPLIEGGTLRARMANGRLPLDEAVAMARDVASALGRAHERGIVHRDLKPENILFTHRGAASGDWGRALVADLGLGKFVGAEPATGASRALSVSGELRGTIGYMAPEQARGERAVGPPADVYALGTILYECLAGEPPFMGETPIEVLAKAVEREAPPVERSRPETPAWLAAAVRAALARDPARRPADGHALARALAPRRSRSRAPVAAALVAALLLAAATVVLARRDAPPEPPLDPAIGVPGSRSLIPHAPPPRSRPAGRTIRPLASPDHPRLPPLEPIWGSGAAHGAMVHAVALSPRGGLVASCALDGLALLWDAETGVEVAALEHRGRALDTLVFSNDGERLYGGEWLGGGQKDCTVLVWNTAKPGRPEVLAELAGTGGPVALGRDGTHLLRLTDAGFCIWDLAARTRKDFGAGPVAAVAWGEGTRSVLAGGKDGAAVLHELATGRVRHFGVSKGLNAIAVSSDARRALEGDEAGAVTLRDLETGRELWRLATVEGDPRPPELTWVRSVAMTPDGSVGLSGGGDGLLRVLDLNARREISRLRGHRLGWITSVAIDARGGTAVSGGNDGTIRGWDLAGGAERWKRSGPVGRVSAIAPIPGAERVVAGALDGSVHVWDPSSADPVLTIAEGGEPVTAVSAAPDGTVAWAQGGRAYSSGLATGAKTSFARESPSLRNVRAVVALDATRVVVASIATNGTNEVSEVALWDPSADVSLSSTGASWLGHELGTVAAIRAGDAVQIFADDARGGVHVFELPSRRVGRLDVGHQGRITALVALPDNERVLSASADGTLRVWRADGSGEARVVRTGQGAIGSVSVSPDGTRAATVGQDRSIALWSLETGEQLDARDLAPVHDFANTVSFGGSGAWLAVGTLRGSIFRFAADR